VGVSEVSDNRGRIVVLPADRWQHIIEGHPELVAFHESVLNVIRRPERVLPGRHLNESWHYGTGGPSQFIKVVVHWDGDRGVIVTAFARRRLP